MLGDFVAILPRGAPIEAERKAWLRATAAERGLPCWTEIDGALIGSAASPEARLVGDDAVTFVGTVFERRNFAPSTGRSSASTTARRILADHWGSFVAILSASHMAQPVLVRDTSGGRPSYYLTTEDVLLVSTSLALLELLDDQARAVDPLGIMSELLYPNLRGRRTCLEEVRELLPGEAISVQNGAITVETIWSPARYLQTASPVADFDEAAATIGDAVRVVTRALYERYQHVLLTLSGGLDSSVIAVAGRPFPARTSYLNLVSSTGLGDEQVFARNVSDFLGADLKVRRTKVEDVNPLVSAARARPRPSARSFTQALLAQTVDAAVESNADAILYGHGGDNVFCYVHSASPAADRLGQGFWSAVADIATVTHCSIPQIAWSALRHRLLAGRQWRWPREPDLLTRDARRVNQAGALHPWLAEQSALSAGRRSHVRAIMTGLAYVDYLDNERGIPTVFPLLAQPVIEACLRVPGWMWYRGGVNRAPVRAAFLRDLPSQIAARPSKGDFAGFARALYRANHARIRDMLMTGFLVDRGIVDRAALESALKPTTPAHDLTYVRLLRLADVEAWIAARDEPRKMLSHR